MMSLSLLFDRRGWLAWLVLGCSLLLTGITWQSLRGQGREGARQQFELHARDVETSIQDRLRQHEQVLLGGAGLFDASGAVTPEAWRAYVERQNLPERLAGFQRMGYIELVPAARLAAHVAAQRARQPGYAVRPPGERALHAPAIYLEPADSSFRVLGLDHLGDTLRGDAVRAAGGSGQPRISAPLRLLIGRGGSDASGQGFLMYVPVYRPGMPLATPEERWAAVRGFVYSAYRMEDLLRGLLGDNLKALEFEIRDAALVEDAGHLHASPNWRASGTPALLHAERDIRAYGRTWRVRMDSSAEFETQMHSPVDRLVLVLGGGVSILLFLVVGALTTRRAEAEKLAGEMTEEIRRNEQQLRLSEMRLTDAQRTAQIGNWELDLIGGQLYWSDEIFRLFEIDQTQFPASYEGFLNAIHPDDREAVNRAYTESLNDRQPYEITHRLRMADGRIKWVHERCATDFDTAGKPLRSRGTVQDITQLTESQRAAQENAQQLQAILDNVVDGIITIDEHGSVQSFNRAATTIFGYAAAEVLGRNVNLLMPEPHHSRHDAYLRAYRETGVRHIIGSGREVEGLRKDGSVFPMDLAVSQSMHAGQALYIGVVRDITERKRMDKMKSEFVSTVSHELRTPLTSIRGALGLITGGAVGAMPEQAVAMLRIASNNTERLLLLINDILDMQKIESGQMTFRFSSLELMPFLEQALADLASYGEQHGVRFVITQASPDARVYADKDRLAQVMANLLSNAAKFSPRGATVEVAVLPERERMRIAVTDHGPGIPEDFRPKLFERFTQSDSSDTRQKGGTGLGLAITKAIVEKHGGQIGFDTEVGKGTTFYVDLPQLANSGADLMRAATAATPTAGNRALVVEDDPDVAALVQRMLADVGYHADVAHDAAQARALLGRRPGQYKFMTLDLVLPGEDGLSLLRDLRAQEATRALPVVVVSAKAGEVALEVNGGAVGVVDWLSKPIDQNRLISVVRQLARPGQLARVLHVEDDPDIQQVVQAMLRGHCELVFASTVQAGRELLERESFNLVLLDIGLPDGSGLDLLEVVERRVHPPQVVVFSAQEVPSHLAEKVSAALVKSRTSNEKLLHILLEAVNRE